ncbi:MAG: BON domain-containing protein [Rhodoferax sp.]|uniref:BON domain-containing protein n=1 Tax=Rhodoferax sp. TaxID=50421 RepID=UPI0027365A03|nr:BON domain-containing protein [Rhodoferax sp.]MDP2681009.1 BON domain-containing protein [Rhodoferax sp.]
MTRNPLGLRIAGTTLAGVMALYMAGCSKVEEPARAPEASTTIGTEIDDSLLTTRVKAALLDNIDIKSFDLKVETHKGDVMLSGFVDNQDQIDHALAIARSVPGVVTVSNGVSLKGAPTTIGTKIDDTVITAQVKAALMADDSVKSADIAAVTRDGMVQLSGFVNNQEQIDRALEVARTIKGVSSVDNQMTIKK